MDTWPEDILFIRYAALAENPVERLHRFSLISMLLNKPPGLYRAENLGLEEHDWTMLCEWINQRKGSYFWRLGPEGIHIQHMCEKHIIIGTSQLLTDVLGISKKLPVSQQPTIDDIWRAAHYYVKTKVTLETD